MQRGAMPGVSDPAALLARMRGEEATAAVAVAEPTRPRVGTSPWPVMDAVAYQGLAGEVVQAIDPTTEADPVAVLVNLLIAFGNAIGRGPHLRIGQARHGTNEFALLVGDTAKARKGSSRDGVRALMAVADPLWADRLASGLSSGEGLIWAVRDPITKLEQQRERGRPTGETVTVVVDEGGADKRLLVEEEEFSNVLKQIERQGNTLSEVTRAAWDARERLQVLTKLNAAVATDAHISVIGHITATEYVRRLTATEQANGLANRFLHFCVTRSKVCAFLPRLDEAELQRLGMALRRSLIASAGVQEVRFTEAARTHWEAVYPRISAPGLGLQGAMTARAETHTLRLALIYALLAGTRAITEQHLLGACALMDYARASVAYIFGDATGDPILDRVLQTITQADCLSRTDLHNLFQRNLRGSELERALQTLLAAGAIIERQDETTGRTRTLYLPAPSRSR